MKLHERRIALSAKIVAIAVCLSTVLGISTVTATLMLARSNMDSTITEMSKVGLRVLQNDLNLQVQDAIEEAEYAAESEILAEAIHNNKSVEIAKYCEQYLEDDNRYVVITAPDGNTLYATDNHYLAAYDSEESGISNIGNKLTAQATVPILYKETEVAKVAYIIDLADEAILDSIKAQVDAEVTLFLNDTRYNTTLFVNNKRNIGSKASDSVITRVLQKGMEFASQVKIEGVNYYAEYMPIRDNSGEIIGMCFSGFPSASTDNMFTTIIIIAIGIGLAFIVVTGILLTLSTIAIVTKPLKATIDVVNQLHNGTLSTADIQYNFYNDELGDFARNLTEAKHILSDYITDIKETTACMAAGDFSHNSDINYIGDFAQIKQSFLNVSSNMRQLISGISASTEQVSLGASQMADGAQSLADGTTRQATAVEELTSTIVDISKQIENTANNARTANDLAEQTSTKMQEQDVAMHKMLSAMQTIQKQTDDIASVITTIEDIAFQTNILALNASIEAARAGEVGKGFAVVADEVRNLAAKSAQAASHTKELITEAVNAVKLGSSLAEDTANVMSEVTSTSTQTIALVSEIATAADQQASAVEQVTTGIEQISQVTTMNSATAEESAASCEELSSMAAELKTQISTLKA